MKKLLVLMLCSFAIVMGASAQTEVKVKPTSTPVQKVHNVVHRKKHYNGYKVKRKSATGRKTTTKVTATKSEVEVKP